MKKTASFVAGAFFLIAGFVGLIFFMTSGMTKTADSFFEAVAENEYDTAYNLLSDDFRASTTLPDLQAYVKANGFDAYDHSNWSGRSIEGGRGNLVGSITTTQSTAIPVTLDFINADGWKIYAISKPKPGLTEAGPTAAIPSVEETVELVAGSMRVFASSVNDKSMKEFHAFISHLWRAQSSPEMFEEMFASIIVAKIDLSILDQYRPQFDAPPSINEDGLLVVTGRYPTRPSEVTFEQKYIYEGLDWKLVGFSVKVKPVE